MRLVPRVTELELSVTLALDARAKALRAAGRDIVNMAVGEPDFPAPEIARQRASERALSGDVRYTPAAGTESLRRAVADQLRATRGVGYEAQDVTICHSAKHALSAALEALVEAPDEVVIPLPAWVSYFAMVQIAGGKSLGVHPRGDGSPDFDAIERAIGPNTRGMLLNSPSNPSGRVLTRAELLAFAELAEKHDLWILSDEIYRRLTYDGAEAASPVSVHEAAHERTVIVDGASKSFAMTGYRIGYVAGPRDLVASVTRLTSQTTGAPNTISQDAFEAVLRQEPPEVAHMVTTFAARRDRIVAGLEQIGLELPRPEGAFYAFPNVAPWLDERGSVGFCEDLLEAKGLTLVPGAAFGLDQHVRLSYATSQDAIDEALRRLGAFLAERPRTDQIQPARSTNQ